MKKIAIATLITLTLGSTQAEYVIKYPLEQSQGGSLPSGSIQFGAPRSAIPAIPPRTKTPTICSFSLESPAAYWIVIGIIGSSFHEYGIYNDLDVGLTPDKNNKYPSEFTDANSEVTYSRGAFVTPGAGDIKAYEICVSRWN